MHTIEIERNGVPVCVVGAPNAIMLSVNVDLQVEGPAAGMLQSMGMNDLGNDRQSHTCWIEELVLAAGDTISLRFDERNEATPPAREVATDSEENLADQRWYDEQLRENPFVPTTIPRNLPTATLELLLPNATPIVATFEGEREFISLRLLWDQWRPERCRVSLSSFSQQEALARVGRKEWFAGYLQYGEQCAAKIGG